MARDSLSNRRFLKMVFDDNSKEGVFNLLKRNFSDGFPDVHFRRSGAPKRKHCAGERQRAEREC